ncbi:MAG: ATP-binding protein [Bacteroidia bacterium]|nr:ATP-binding protein [Bacteroidia bacterium]
MPTAIRITSTQKNMHLVEKMIDGVCAQLKLDEATYGKVYVGVTEAVYNSMLHGNALDAKKNIDINYEIKPNYRILKVTVTDEGNGFNPNELPNPIAPENILKESGRGVFLIKQMATRYTYNTKGNSITMEFDY